MEPPKPGDPAHLGGIALRGRLGEGGMGIVYYGVTPAGDEVAVKTIRDQLLNRPDLRGRFEREVQAMEMVQGPRVANLIDASQSDEPMPWFASEYVRGHTLKEYVAAHGVLPANEVTALGIALAEALVTIHQAGVLHRDLKPGNIILSQDGPRVIDFGLAALTERPGDLTYSHDVLGTPVCMSPEQAISSRDVTASTDVYALGATLTFAAAKHYPYHGPTLRDMQNAITDPAVEPDLSGIPGPLVPAISGLLAYSAAARPTADEVLKELANLLTKAGAPNPGTAIARLAQVTFRERPGDPEPRLTLPPPERWPEPLGDPHVPSILVRQAADRLRRDYAASASF